jgi:hypothetical protein
MPSGIPISLSGASRDERIRALSLVMIILPSRSRTGLPEGTSEIRMGFVGGSLHSQGGSFVFDQSIKRISSTESYSIT